MNESKFSKHVCGIIQSTCGGHVSRVEAHDSASGIPDLDYCVSGNEGHIELKVGSGGNPPTLRASQVLWLRRRTKAGGCPIILCLNTDTNEVYLVCDRDFEYLQGKCPIVRWGSHASLIWDWGDDFAQGLSKYLKECGCC